MDYTPRAIFAMIAANRRDDVLASNTMWCCVSCYFCTARCPQEIPITETMYTLKRMAIREGKATEGDAPEVADLAQEYAALSAAHPDWQQATASPVYQSWKAAQSAETKRLIDSDIATERLVRAGLALAGLDPDDRDSPAYKRAYRDAVYEAMFDLAVANLPHVPVVLAGPFTREGGEADWPERLERRLGVRPVMHFVWCPPDVRRARMIARRSH
jgi:predicted kinase